MQFEILLILACFLIIAFLWFINMVITYLRLSKVLLKLKNQFIQDILLLLDLNVVIQQELNPNDLQSALDLKNSVWNSHTALLSVVWTNSVPVLDQINNHKTSLQPASELQIKVEKALKSFYENLHLYNQEVLLVQKKEHKPFFRLINKLFLHLDFQEISALGNY